MNQNQPTIHVSFEGFSATSAQQARVEAKAAKLHRHHVPHIGSLQLHFRHEPQRTGAEKFSATATLRAGGRDAVLHAAAAEPEALINEVFSKLERSVQDQAGERKHDRHSVSTAATSSTA